jgi:hypothetical protein
MAHAGNAVMKTKLLLVLAFLVPLAGCASMPTPQQRAERAARVEAAAGAPVNYIQLIFRGLYGWHAINDHQVVAYVTPKRAYLLDLPPCPGIEQSNAIAVTSNMERINVNFDSVTGNVSGVPCQIRRIRPLDMAQLKKANEIASKDVQVEPRPEKKTTKTGA